MPKRKSLSEAFGVEPETQDDRTEEASSTPETTEASEQASSSDEAARAGESVQYGKRADPTYAQVTGNIPEMLKRRFKAKVSLEGRDISSTLEELIRKYVEEGEKIG